MSVVLDLLPYADLVAGMLLYDRERADEVARAWLGWTRNAPETATTSLRVMSFPPLPELPPFLSGRDLVVVDGAILEDDATADALLAPLRALGPEIDTFGRIPAAGLTVVHMDPPAPVSATSDHCLLRELDDAAVDAFLAQVGDGTRSGLMFAEIRHLGGAFARPADGGGALTSIEAPYCLLATAVAPDAVSATLGREAAAAVVRALEPWAAATLAPTFTESAVEADRFHDAATLERLRAVRDRIDPDRVIRAGHAL